MHIFLITTLAVVIAVMLYYRLRMDIVLFKYGKLRLIPPRFGGESIKIFVSIIKNEQDPKLQAKYTSIYNGIKYSRRATLIAVTITFVAIILTGQ